MLVAGVFALLVGLVGAGALWYASGQRYDDNVAAFARAPSGCATTLDFDRTGTFTLYTETTGRIDELAGDCEQTEDYDRDDVPEIDVVIVDPDGDEVPVEEVSGSGYDTTTFVGVAVGEIDVAQVGDHVITVQRDGAPFAVAVGGAADAGVAPLRWGAIALAIVGMIAGGLLLAAGSRRPTSIEPAAVWQPSAGAWPSSPPGFPAPPATTGTRGTLGTVGPPMVAPPVAASPPPGPTPTSTPTPTPPRPGWGPPTLG
jgi:hypothetical protein